MLRERRRHASFKPNRKLDRKSSRGMIYENEELRLRTININAEVERGQSDIKKLRRENYQLRKEIWTLRDEHDRLGKLLRRNCDAGGSSGSAGAGNLEADEKIAIDDDADVYGYEYDEEYRCCSCHSNEDDISCDICNEGENDASSGRTDSTNELTTNMFTSNTQMNSANATAAATTSSILKTSSRPEKIDINFDHLSVVSEECLSNSDDQVRDEQRRMHQHRQHQMNDLLAVPPTSLNDADNFVPETAAAQIFTDFQSTVPPLAHFENLSYKDIGPNVDLLGELHYNGESTPTTGETVVPRLVWDFDLHQPLPSGEILPATSTSSISLTGTAATIGESTNSTTNIEKDFVTPKVKNFFAPLKSKVIRQMQTANENTDQDALRPDLYIGNVLACETNKLATIRRPHHPLKCPISQQSDNEYANVSRQVHSTRSDAALENILHDIEDLSKGIEHMQFHNNQIYESIRTDEMHQPFRTEMSVVLSYDGNRKKITENHQPSPPVLRSDTCIGTDGTNSPMQTLPRAMKLLPNTLPYIKKDTLMASTSQSDSNPDDMERENDENAAMQDANGEITTRNVNFVATPTTDDGNMKEDASTKGSKNATTIASMRKHFFGRKSSVAKINRKDSIITDETNTEQDTENVPEEIELTQNGDHDANNLDSNSISSRILGEPVKRSKSARRVSIHFNSKPNGGDCNESSTAVEFNEPDAQPVPSSDVDEIKHTPILCSRRHHSIASRKDSIGSIIYASPLCSRRGIRKSVLSRRHSDGILPFSQRNQYYPHLESSGGHSSAKHMTNRHHNLHHHAGVHHHHHNTIPAFKEPDNFPDMLGTCNSLASSRESSTSLSQRSTSQQQKRKISITSHSQSGGKIPWCACWGNGCL